MESLRIIREFKISRSTMRNLLFLMILGAAVSVVGVLFVPERTWPNILLAAYYLTGVGFASVVFIALMYVSNAGWATAFRRIPEALTYALFAGAPLMMIVLLGAHSLYSWSRPEIVQEDHLLQLKTAWLNIPFFSMRTVLYLAIWSLFAFIIIQRSRAQDVHNDLRLYHRNKTSSAIFLVVAGLTFTLASMDWVMSLEPKWYSTIFGIYNIIGTFLNGLAVITLLVLIFKRKGPLEHVITGDHLHSLGKLIFAFSTFWMYIWFSQFMLIWYANIPEEVTYMVNREKGSWLIFTIINVVFNWAIPFIALLPAWTKKQEGVLLRICIIIMIGHWLDLFWMILPPFMPNAPVLNIWEIAPITGAVAALFYFTFRTLARHNPLPVNDPMLIESIPQHHEV